MGPLNDEKKLQIDEKNNKNQKKIEKSLKIFKTCNVINFRTNRYKLTTSVKIIHSILN